MGDAVALPLTEAQLNAERRSLLGDQRSVDKLEGPALQRWVEVCGLLRAMKRARGEIAPRAGKALRKTLDITDL